MDLKLRFFLITSISVILSLTACKKTVHTLGINISIEKRTLKNGMTVLFIPDPNSTIISYQTWIRAGTIDEPAGQSGITKIIERVLFRGTEKAGTHQIFTKIEANGAELNAQTGQDYTFFYENFSIFQPSIFDEIIKLETERFTHFNLDESRLTIEKQISLEERQLRLESTPSAQIQEALWALSFKKHPYRFPLTGAPQELMSLTVDQVKQHANSYFNPANITLIIVGAIGATGKNQDLSIDTLFTKIKKAYEAIPSSPAPARNVASEPQQKEERRLILRDTVASEQLSLGYPITAAEDNRSFALDVLANILTQGTQSRLHRKLIDEKKIAIAVDSSSYTPAYPGLFTLSVILNHPHTAIEAEEAINSVIKTVKESGVTREEVQSAVKQLTVQMVDTIRTPQGLGLFIGAVQSIFNTPEHFEQDLNKYMKITPENVQSVANDFLDPNNRNVIILMPTVKK